MFHPILLSKDTPYETEEGCLSLSGVRKTTRYENIEVEYYDMNWKKGYLYRVSNFRIEDLVDEMLSILSDRDAIIQKKEMEHAQAVINEIYRNGL